MLTENITNLDETKNRSGSHDTSENDNIENRSDSHKESEDVIRCEEIVIGTAKGTTFPVKTHGKSCNALIDTGAIRSCIKKDFYNQLQISDRRVQTLYGTFVRSANGSSLGAVGEIECIFQIGKETFKHIFIMCENMVRPMILGEDFLQKHLISINYGLDGLRTLSRHSKIIDSTISIDQDPTVRAHTRLEIPPRSVAIFEVNTEGIKNATTGQIYQFMPNSQIKEHYPGLCFTKLMYNLDDVNKPFPSKVLTQIINLYEEPAVLKKGAKLGTLLPTYEDINCISAEMPLQEFEQWKLQEKLPVVPEDRLLNEINEISDRPDEFQLSDTDKQDILPDLSKLGDRQFIISPADVDMHRKTNLEDADVTDEQRERLDLLLGKYTAAFSQHSADIGRTPLIEMDIDTGDHPPICQRPYNLPLKHLDWVKKELNMLEAAGVIESSVSPWASPVVIVPKKSDDGTIRRRLCVDFRALNALTPPVKKVGSNAKGVLSYVPLPKIDELYARLKGSRIYSTLDMRSGYYHMKLTKAAQPKTAFVTPLSKMQWRVTPFGLAQAPAYFMSLVNKVLSPFDYAFGYLDDILIFSPDVETHLEHLEQVFKRLIACDLKLKMSKCFFLKRHIQYLGHLLSGEGVSPVPEKLESLEKMPPPTNPKEIKQFLGLAGYYRKFIPRFADISRPMTRLTRKNVDFEWEEKCQLSFELLKEKLITGPILIYPDPQKPYVMFTDASKFGWSNVLTQLPDPVDKLDPLHAVAENVVITPENNMPSDVMSVSLGKTQDELLRPITYNSGLMRGSQLNWAALTKEAYAIFSSVRKLTYYIEDADTTLRSDHLPLRKFLEKNTLNTKVNNWAVEISPFRIKFEYIKGIKNTLADTMSRLLMIDPDYALEPEPDGYEFGCYAFDPLPPIEVHEIIEITTPGASECREQLRISALQSTIRQEQGRDAFCKQKIEKAIKTKESNLHYYLDGEGLLHKNVKEDNSLRQVLVIPRSMTPIMLKMAHDDLGHNGANRTYAYLRQHVYWKGMKPETEKHVRKCPACQARNPHVAQYAKLHFDVAKMPMEFISMDLIGPFYPKSSQGNTYALTVICMLTGWVTCVPIPNKETETVIEAYLHHVYVPHGGSRKILSDNGTEFKNAKFEQIAEELGVQYKVYSAPYTPQSNGRIETFHSFLKNCIAKHVSPSLEWDKVVPLACAAYNFMPNKHMKEAPFFVMYGRDPLLPLNSLLSPKVRYLGDDSNLLSHR